MIYKKSWKYILCKDTTPCCTEFSYYRLKSLKEFGDVKKGDIGGYIRKYNNLSQFGDCWVYENAMITDDALISENAKIFGSSFISDNARITGNAKIYDCTKVYHNSYITGNTVIKGFVSISSNAEISGNVIIKDFARVSGKVSGNVEISENVIVCSNTVLSGNTKLFGSKLIGDDLQKILEV
jgi:UDP-3-O-[3-hydroxymyristoyl] glucosamine N-acyltransferase